MPYAYNRSHLHEYCFAAARGYGQVLQAWSISQINGGTEAHQQLISAGKSLWVQQLRPRKATSGLSNA